MWCRLGWLLVLAALLLSGRWATARTLDEQLQHWQQQEAAVSYQGSFIYERKGVFSTHRIWRKVDSQGQVRERFVRLNGNRLEAQRLNGRLECMARQLQSGQLAAIEEPTMPLRRFNLQHVAAGYVVEQLGIGRVADREAAVLMFGPRDAHRYPLEVYFDLETGVVLKSLLLNSQGEPLERFQFVSLEVVEPEESRLQVQDCEPAVALEAAGEAAVPAWQAQWLPEGFVAAGESIVKDSLNSQLFFDGLTHFSIFVAKVKGEFSDLEHHQLGPTVVISRLLDLQGEDYLITVLGEIPVVTAQRIALSVDFAQETEND